MSRLESGDGPQPIDKPSETPGESRRWITERQDLLSPGPLFKEGQGKEAKERHEGNYVRDLKLTRKDGWDDVLTAREKRALADALDDVGPQEWDEHASRIRFEKAVERLRTDPVEARRITELAAELELDIKVEDHLSQSHSAELADFRPSIAAGNYDLTEDDLPDTPPSIEAGRKSTPEGPFGLDWLGEVREKKGPRR